MNAFFEKTSKRYDFGIPREYRNTITDFSIAYSWYINFLLLFHSLLININ